MSANRIVVAAAGLLLTAFVVIMAVGISHSSNGSAGAGTDIGPLILVAVVLVALIVLGSRLYGSNSHYGRAAARTRPAQDAHNRSIDEARAQKVGHDAADDPSGPETETPP